MLEVNGTLLILVVSFLAFIWMLDMVFVTPVSKTLEARSRKIQEDLDNSKDLRKEAEAVLSQYEKHLAEVREKAQATINDAVGEAQKKRSEAVSKIQEEGRGRLDAAKASLASEKRSLVEQWWMNRLSWWMPSWASSSVHHTGPATLTGVRLSVH